MSDAVHVMFAGGGAAGHLFPGLAVAEHLSQLMPSARITFAGPSKPREKHTIRTAGYEHTAIPAQPIPQNPLQALRFVTDNIAGYCAARWLLGEQQVSLVVGLGGFTSTAVVRAAAARGIPFICSSRMRYRVRRRVGFLVLLRWSVRLLKRCGPICMFKLRSS